MKKEIRLLLTLLAFSFFSTGILMWLAEQHNPHLNTFENFIWWWVVTSTTVGYGDIVPITHVGRLAGVIAIIVGIFGYTHTISLILTSVRQHLEAEERGRTDLEVQDHILICDYTAFADELIQEIPSVAQLKDKPIVVLSSLVDRRPYPDVKFVYGVPISPSHLKRACADKASIIFVFSNSRFSDPDTKTLHVVSRIMRFNESAPIFVELCDTEHKLIQNLPRPIITMKCTELLESAVSHRFLEIERYLKQV